MRLAGACLLLALLASPAVAQESCDVKVALKASAGSARLMQIASCGDGNSTTLYACAKNDLKITVVVPLTPFDAKPGATFNVKFKLSGGFDTRKLTVVAPLPGGGGDVGGQLQLAASDPLWKALARPGADIFADAGDQTTTVGMVSTAAGKLKTFKQACGLK